MYLNYIYLLILVLKSNASFKLNYPKVLLPFYSQNLVSFILEIKEENDDSNGKLCFEWTTSRPDIISIAPIYEFDYKCSTKANVSAVSRISQKAMSIISVKETNSGKFIRCDVISDQINSISIKHTTTQLYLEDSPELFSINAFDSEGNSFTSLEGIPFEWLITQDSILKKTNLITSKYAYSDKIRDLEIKGLNGHKILIEGLKTGTSKVKAFIKDSFYKQMTTDNVELLVVANLILEPSYPVYLLKNDVITYKVKLIRQTTIETIQLPSDQYYLECENSTVGKLLKDGSSILAKEYGKTTIKLIDTNMKEFSHHYSPTQTSFFVVEPNYLSFTLKNWNSWVLENGRVYEIQVNLMTTDGNQIYLSENTIIEANIDTSLFDILKKTTNGTYYEVRTRKSGQTLLNGHLLSNKNIIGEQTIEILEPIQVNPSKIIIAFDNKAHYSGKILVTGGSGVYQWEPDSSFINIDSNGHFKISTDNQKSFRVEIYDVKNHYIRSFVEILIVKPTSIDILECPIESIVGDLLRLRVKLTGIDDKIGQSVQITNCENLIFNVFLDDSTLFEYESISPSQVSDYGACSLVNLKTKTSGITSIKLSYKFESQVLEAQRKIYSFNRLNSSKDRVILAKDSSYLISLNGGPSELLVGEYNLKTISEDSNTFELVQISTQTYQVKCRTEKTNGDLKVLMARISHSPNECPLNFEVKINIHCSIPNSIELYRHIVDTRLPKCLLSNLIAYKNSLFTVGVVAREINGFKFDNFTSLKLTWSVNKANFLTDHLGIKNDGEDFYQIFQAKSISGQGTLTAVYKQAKSEIDIKVVDPIQVSPHSIALFNLPNIDQKVKISHGSGYYYVNTTIENEKITDLNLKDDLLTLKPIKNGQLSVDIYDYCTSSDNNRAILPLTVTEIEKIFVELNKTKIEFGEEIRIKLKIGDLKGNYLNTQLFNLLNLKPTFSPNLISINFDNIVDEFNVQYSLKALDTGLVTFRFETNKISSQMFELVVFEKLKIEPKELEIVIGSSYGLKASGGPQTEDAILKYSSDADNIIDLTQEGTIKAIQIGNVLVKIQSIDKYDSSKIYSEDTISIRVVKITSIHINMPLKSIKRTNSLPISLSVNRPGSNVIYQSSESLLYHWQIIDKNLIDIENSVLNSKLNLSDSNFSFIINAKKSGNVQISVKLTSSDSNVLVSDSLEDQQSFSIFDETTLYYSNNKLLNNQRLLVSPGSKIQFKTNKDSFLNVNYELNLDNCESNSISISNNGLLNVSESISTYCGASLVVRIQENLNKDQILNYYIMVKPINYFMIINDNNHVDLGTIKLVAYFYDDIGDRFDYVSERAAQLTTNFDFSTIAQVKSIIFTDNSVILMLNILKSGIVNINLATLSYSQIFQFDFNELNYFNIENGNYFTCDLIYMSNGNEWISESPSIAQIINDNTILCLQPGQANIKLNEKKSVILNVKSINNKIQWFNDPHQKIILQEGYSNVIPLKFGPQESSLKGFSISNLTKFELDINKDSIVKPFDCYFQLNENNGLFFDLYNRYITIRSILKDGIWSCEVIFNQNYSLKDFYDIVSNNLFTNSMRIWVELSEGRNLIKSKDVELSLITSFYVQTKQVKVNIQDKNQENLVISVFKNVADSLEIYISHSNLVQVKKNYFKANKQYYEVSLVDGNIDNILDAIQENDIYIQVSSELTKKSEKIQIKFITDRTSVFINDKKGVFGTFYDLIAKYIIEFLIFLIITLLSILFYINLNSKTSLIPVNRAQFQSILSPKSSPTSSTRQAFKYSTPYVQRDSTIDSPSRLAPSPIPTTEPIRLFSTDVNNQTLMDYERNSFNARHRDTSPRLHRSF